MSQEVVAELVLKSKSGTTENLSRLIESLKILEISDMERFSSVLLEHPQWTSELSFTNLFAWAPIQYPRWGQFHNHLLVQYDPGNTGESNKFLQPIGADPKAVMEVMHREYGIEFVRVDGTHLSDIPSDIYTELSPKDHDYLYTAKQVSEISGSQGSELRRRVNKFNRTQGEFLHSSLITSETIEDAKTVTDKWLQERLSSAKSDSDRNGKIEDATACHRILDNWDNLPGLMGAVIYHKGEPVSFGVGELVNHHEAPHGLLISHFEKSVISKEFEGLPVYCFQKLCEPLHPACVVNRMQAAGVEGLRIWKESWGPFGMREKGNVGTRPVRSNGQDSDSSDLLNLQQAS